MDANKWQVIQNWSSQRMLGSVNYLSKFIPHHSSFRKPLQDLLEVHDDAFKTLKSTIVKNVTLKYFDSSHPIYIETDASKKGIGVMMLQPDNSVENTFHAEVPNNLSIYSFSHFLTPLKSRFLRIVFQSLILTAF